LDFFGPQTRVTSNIQVVPCTSEFVDETEDSILNAFRSSVSARVITIGVVLLMCSARNEPKNPSRYTQHSQYRRPPLFDGPLFRPFSIITRTHTFDACSALSTYFVCFHDLPRASATTRCFFSQSTRRHLFVQSVYRSRLYIYSVLFSFSTHSQVIYSALCTFFGGQNAFAS
jgi:hypothetical protein